MKEFQACARKMLDFIDASPTPYHVVENLQKMLENHGYHELKETDAWQVEPGNGYYVTRNGSSVIAFRIPADENLIKGFHIVASHSDSPTFKVKESPDMQAEGVYAKLNTEKYGGMILSTWLDRALSVAGRVVVRSEKAEADKDTTVANVDVVNEPSVRLVNMEEDLLVIPNLAIHMNRDLNKGVEYNPQIDMLPLFGMCEESKTPFMEKLAQAAGVSVEQILGHDLFLYPREKGRIIGENGAFVLSPRLDDLQCVFASMTAFAQATPTEYINVCAVFDNEEVGSGTKQGADSTFLEDVLVRVGETLGYQRSEYLRMIAGSFMISADNAHAVHPNRPEKADPTNRPFLNGGVVIKYHGSQKYCTDGVSGAKVKELCEKAKVPYQTYANRSDVAGGSTLGNLSNAHVSLSGADIGLPQLAMHSAVETAGVKDTKYAQDMFAVYFAE